MRSESWAKFLRHTRGGVVDEVRPPPSNPGFFASYRSGVFFDLLENKRLLVVLMG